MRFCTNCGKQLADEAKFCTGCGAECITIPDVVPTEASAPEKPAEKIPMRETPAPQPPKPKKEKKKSKAKVIFICVLSAILLLAAIAGVVFLLWYNSPEQQALRALEVQDYASMEEVLADDEDVQESEKVAEQMLARIALLKTGFWDETMDFETVWAELDAMERLDISSVESEISNARAYIADLKGSKDCFYRGESSYKEGNYAQTIENYRMVHAEDLNYATAMEKLAAAEKAFRDETLSNAAEYAQNDLYVEAADILRAGLEVLPDDADFLDMITTYEDDHVRKLKADALSAAKNYANKGDYIKAIETLQNILKTQRGADLESALSNYSNQYVSAVSEEIEELIGAKDFDQALTVVNAAIKVLPDNATLKAKLEEVKAKSPVPLSTLNVINGGWQWNNGNPVDPFGNDYSTVNNYVLFKRYVNTESYWNNTYDYKGYAEYRLYGKYKTLSFNIAPHTDMGEKASMFVQVYADDVLVYTSPTVYRKTDIFPCEANVSGAEYIKVEVYTTYEGAAIVTDMQLWP